MFYAILALVDDGDEVIYPNPGFPIYESMIQFVGGAAVPIQIEEARDFSLDVEKLCDADHRTHAHGRSSTRRTTPPAASSRAPTWRRIAEAVLHQSAI